MNNLAEWYKWCNACKVRFEFFSETPVVHSACGGTDVKEWCDHDKKVFNGEVWWCTYCGAEWDKEGNRLQHHLPGRD